MAWRRHETGWRTPLAILPRPTPPLAQPKREFFHTLESGNPGIPAAEAIEIEE
jgi:hypothetical protein